MLPAVIAHVMKVQENSRGRIFDCCGSRSVVSYEGMRVPAVQMFEIKTNHFSDRKCRSGRGR